MRRVLVFAVIVAVFSSGDAYSKYGRTCKDIGCSRNEVCMMQEDVCTTYTRNNECGKYPTCKKISEAAATCTNYVCPPTKMCRVDRGEPKCIDDPSAAINRENKQTVQSYNPGAPAGETPNAPNYPPQVNYPQNPGYNPNYPQNPGYNPNYPQNPGNPQNSNYPQNTNYQNPGVYPNLPSGGGTYGQTTSRPNVYQPGQHASGGGYQGGVIGSGYPGQGGNTRHGSGYPAQGGGYPGQQYSGQGGYSNQGGGYPKQGGGYPNQGGSYPNQGSGYHNQNQGGQRYGQKSGETSSNPLLDRITDTLKTIGLFWFLVKFMVSRFNGIYS